MMEPRLIVCHNHGWKAGTRALTPPIIPDSSHELLSGSRLASPHLGDRRSAQQPWPVSARCSLQANLYEPPRRPKTIGALLPRGTLFVDVAS